ncbi:MAG: NADAR family protein [Cellvibrio sp.]
MQEFIAAGAKPEFLFFWGHRQSGNSISKSCFSQWYESAFDVDDVHYKTAEHYMMAQKALLFGDNDIYEKILNSNTPDEAKSLGRKVRGFKDDIWSAKSFDIVVNGNVEKFSQNEPLRNFLLSTGDKILVEASPVDPVWGIGLAEGDEQAKDPTLWRGKNLLGFTLMAVREKIRK